MFITGKLIQPSLMFVDKARCPMLELSTSKMLHRGSLRPYPQTLY